MAVIANLSRRDVLKGGTLAAGGLVLGFGLSTDALLAQETAAGRINGWIRIDPDDAVTITLTNAEMGQGVHTAIPMILAEELEADWSKIRVVKASALPFEPGAEGARPNTGGSRSIRSAFEPLSKAGASAREMLRRAAADRWGVPLRECAAKNGAVYHARHGSLTYGSLAEAASRLSPPSDVKLKDKSEYRLLGKPMNRLDSAEKATGQAKFGIDVRLDNMLVGTVQSCPVYGGRLKSVDAGPAMARSGVRKVIATDNAVIVVADTFWQAKTGLDALHPVWDAGAATQNSSQLIDGVMHEALDHPGAVVVDHGNVEVALSTAHKVVEATYDVPLLHHATMEPMNATAWVHDGQIDIWAPIQSAGRERHSVAEEFGVGADKVDIHVTFLGGGFGRRIGMSFIRPAVIASKEMGVPVQIIWTREEDMAQGMLRPCSVSRFRAGLSEDGLPIAWDNRLVTPSILTQIWPDQVKDGVDPVSLHGAAELQYTIANQRLDYAMPEIGVPLGFWRSVPHSYNAFFVESFVDEVAVATGQDPVALRRRMMAKHPRNFAVLERLATESRWGGAPPKGHYRGLSIHESFGSICGQVVEISMPSDSEIRLEKITAVVDCGVVINPRTIEAQIEGSVVYALSAALYGQIDIEGGAAVQKNFDSYDMLKLADMPPVDVHIMGNGPIGGIGEPGVPPLFAALTNAIFAASGRRIRSLPLAKHGFTLA